MQTTEEAEPLLGVRYKTQSPMPAVGYIVSIRLAANPQVSSSTDLLNRDFIVRFQTQDVDKHQHVVRNEA
jgi:hypothetical protein